MNTARGANVGNFNFSLSVGPTTSPPLSEGLWFITVSNGNAITRLRYTIGSVVYEDLDKHKENVALLGTLNTKPVFGTGEEAACCGEDEWQLIEVL